MSQEAELNIRASNEDEPTETMDIHESNEEADKELNDHDDVTATGKNESPVIHAEDDFSKTEDVVNENNIITPTDKRNKINILQVIDCSSVKLPDETKITHSLVHEDIEQNATAVETVTKLKKRAFIDSDSEEECVKGFNGSASKVYDIDRKGQLILENDSTHKLALNSLCDSESEDEDRENRDTNNVSAETIEPTEYKKKAKKSGSEAEPKKMTAKEAAEQRKEIESDSQRRVREKQVSLPYHKPKQRTLQEFLKLRKRFASAVPKETSNKFPSLAIKMTPEQLKIVSANLKKREKEVEEFFKSESEDEDDDVDDDDKDFVVANVDSEIKQVEGEVALETETVDNVEAAEVPNANENVAEKTALDVGEAVEGMEVDSTADVVNNLNDSSGSSKSMQLVFNLDDMDDEEDAADKDSMATEAVEQAEVKQSTTSELLKERFANTKPCLSGGPNLVIDLDEGVTKPDDVSQLMERFARHACKKAAHKSNVEFSIVSVSGGGEIHKEKVAVKLDGLEQPEINERPGVRLQKLRNELQVQMAQKRAEMWEQRKKLPAKDEELDTYFGEKECCDADEDEENVDDEVDESEVEEDEESILEASEEADHESKCAFLEDQAEESDPQESELEDKDETSSEIDEELEIGKKKPLKRIIKPFGDDSDEDEEGATDSIDASNKSLARASPLMTCDDDGSPPAAQPRSNEKTPVRPKTQQKADFGFLTPVNRLTCLQNFDSKLAIDSPGSPAIKLQEPSPLKSINWHKKLFPEAESQSTQEDSQMRNATAEQIQTTEVEATVEAEEVPSTQELMDLCSGKFTGITQRSHESKAMPESGAQESQAESLPPETAERDLKNPSDDNEDDKFISQLLDEQEMEEFKRKLNSPEKSQEVNMFDVSDDDNEDDDDDDEIIGSKTKKAINAIVDSDEEDDIEDRDEEQIDLHDEDEDIPEVEYDSEENEIEVAETKEQTKKKWKASEFFENEAELSESEWGSADEDEKDLDRLEFELGDTENIDENKVRRDLEKIHMRRLLDDDKRDVKILQEMLLEDGELQGTGRQRQFRWKNIDGQSGEDNPEGNESNDVEAVVDEEEESEEQWRRKRFEREAFLRTSQQSRDSGKEGEPALTSEVFKLGQKAIIINRNVAAEIKEPEKIKLKQPFLMQNQRGSFLSRGEQVLARVAEYTKISNPVVGAAVKNSRNFVFQSVSNSENSEDNSKKRKAAAGGTPAAIKKIRLGNLSPAVGKKAGNDLINSKKKLFGNW